MAGANVFEMVKGSDVAPDTAADLGMKVGTIFKAVGIAVDSEPFSIAVCEAFMSGLSAAGSDSYYVGSCPLPAACMFAPKE